MRNQPDIVTIGRADQPLQGVVDAPGSKSLTNRALVLAALADGESVLHSPLVSDDTLRMADLITAAGAQVSRSDTHWGVLGTSGQPRFSLKEVFVGQSGTTMRFGTALACVAEGPMVLYGTPDLNARPVGPLVHGLRRLGADVVSVEGRPPVTVRSSCLEGGRLILDSDGTSQYASALLMIGPYAREGLDLEVSGNAAFGYVDLTVELMDRFGAEVQQEDSRWRVVPGQRYVAQNLVIAPDISAACHVWSLAVATGGEVTVQRMAEARSQPDAALLDIFEEMGAEVTVDAAGAITVRGPEQPRAIEVDLGGCPDQLPTVAVLASIAEGDTRIRGAAVTRLHETDRISAMRKELAKFGIRSEEHADGLTITGGTAHPATEPLDPHHDHRLAMAFATIAAKVGNTRVADPHCVAKTFPAFWDTVTALGLAVEPRSGATS